MDSVRRVVVRDRHPVLSSEILLRPLNRAVLGVAGLSLAVQVAALVQVAQGHGKSVTWLDHVGFALVALLWLLMGLLVFLQRRARHAGQLFCLSASAGAGFLALGSLYGTGTVNAMLFAASVLLFPAFLLSFTRGHTETRPWHRLELLLYLPAAVLLWPGAQDLAAGRTTIWWKLCLALVAAYLLAAVLQSLADLRSAASPATAAQCRALLVGLVGGTMPGIALFVWPLVTTGSLLVSTSILPLIILLFLIVMSFAVLLFELENADLIVRRGIVYGLIALVIVGVYAALGTVLDISRASVTQVGGIGFVLATIGVGALFAPLQRQGRRFVDWMLYGGRSDRWQTLEELSARLAVVMQPDDLCRALVSDIAHSLHLRGAFILRREASGRFVVGERAGDARSQGSLVAEASDIEAALGSPPAPLLLVHARPLTAGASMSVPESVRMLDELHASLSIPLVARSGLEAVLCLQPKLSHDAFRRDDLQLLTPIIHQAAAALDNALLFSRLEEKVEELRGAYLRIAVEQESERARLARELHDGTAQELAGLITLATVAERQTGADSPSRSTLARLKDRAQAAYQEVRRASHALHPPMLDDFGLAEALDRYLTEFQEGTGIAVAWTADDPGALGRDAQLALFRIAQECMENVRKHSGASSASVSLSREDGRVSLVVRDSGVGLLSAAGTGIGFAGMRERMESVGGVMTVTSGDGVEVRAEVPVSGGEGRASANGFS